MYSLRDTSRKEVVEKGSFNVVFLKEKEWKGISLTLCTFQWKTKVFIYSSLSESRQ